MYSAHGGWPQMLKERQWDKLGGNTSDIHFQIYPIDQTRYAGSYY